MRRLHVTRRRLIGLLASTIVFTGMGCITTRHEYEITASSLRDFAWDGKVRIIEMWTDNDRRVTTIEFASTDGRAVRIKPASPDMQVQLVGDPATWSPTPITVRQSWTFPWAGQAEQTRTLSFHPAERYRD